jgi:hypothetical protein
MLAALLALTLVDQPAMPDAATGPAMTLSACVTLAAARRASERIGNAEAAEAALRDCAAEDRALAAMLDTPQMAAARARNRDRALRNVAIARGEQAPPDTPISLWGRCIGGHARSLSTTSQDVQAIADGALAACRAEEQVAHDAVARERDAATADAMVRSMRANVPALVRQAMEATRATGH